MTGLLSIAAWTVVTEATYKTLMAGATIVKNPELKEAIKIMIKKEK